MPKQSTSWGSVADWYDEMLRDGEGTFQKDVILPNLLRLISVKEKDSIADIACGQGYFSRHFADAGAQVTGIDISPELISHAEEYEQKKPRKKGSIQYIVAPAHDIPEIKKASIDVAVIVLAIQNIENMNEVFVECARILKPKGRLFVVLNHPAFRIPKESSWCSDERSGIEYRRIDRYLSDLKVKIDMHPGEKTRVHTVSFHRPLQTYFKSLGKAGFGVTRLEEWISNRQGPAGRKFEASERARKEIPMFLCLEGKKV